MTNNEEYLRSTYEKIFNLEYLVKFGYFDMESNWKRMGREYGRADSVYYDVFNMDDLARAISNGKINGEDFESNCSSEPILFSIPKKEFARRVYKIPNIYHYIENSKIYRR